MCIIVSNQGGIIMEKEQENVKIDFTKEVFISISNDITGQIAQTKQDIEDTSSRIKGRIDYLIELKNEIIKRNEVIKHIRSQKKDIKIKIRDQKRLLRMDKAQKFSLTRELLARKNNSIRLNELYVNDEKTIDPREFYPRKQQKTR